MSLNAPRVVLLGLGSTTLSALLGLVAETSVVSLVRNTMDDTTEVAKRYGVPVVTDAGVQSVRQVVQSLRPDCVVVSSYNRILPADLVESCPFLNVHYAPLPRLRGRATVNWAIIRGESSATISIHHLVAGLDAGNILVQKSVPIGPRSTVTEVHSELNRVQQETIAEAVRAALAGDPGRPQVEADATYGCTRLPEDGEIDWCRTTVEIDRLVRALTDPFPGAFTWLGLDRLIIHEAEPAAQQADWEGRVPGRVVDVHREQGAVDVLTGDGVLRLLTVSGPGGHRRQAAEVIRSVKSTLGLRFPDLVARLHQLEVRVEMTTGARPTD